MIDQLENILRFSGGEVGRYLEPSAGCEFSFLAKIEYRQASELKPYHRNARTHSPEQIDRIAASIREFGWTNPVLVDGNKGVIAGHGRLLAAKKIGIEKIV